MMAKRMGAPIAAVASDDLGVTLNPSYLYLLSDFSNFRLSQDALIASMARVSGKIHIAHQLYQYGGQCQSSAICVK